MAYLFGWREEDLTIGVSNDVFASDYVRKYSIDGEDGFLVPEDCTVNRIWCGVTNEGSSAFKIYIYDGPTGALLGETAEAAVVDGGLFVDLLSPVSVTVGQRIGIATHSASGTVRALGESSAYSYFASMTADYALGAPDPFSGDGSGNGSRVVLWADGTTSTPSLTITDIDGDTEFTPGESHTLNGTNFSTSGGTLVINGETQTITNRTSSAITFTGVRGGNPYNQNLTLTYTDASSNTATLTVQMVPADGEYVVTALNANTTDPASYWYGLVDTATGEPANIVDGTQGLAYDYSALEDPEQPDKPFAITQEGSISAANTGPFKTIILLVGDSEWGAEQTVNFTLPDETGPVVESVSVPADGTYTPGENLDFTANANESVTVTTAGGTPSIPVTVGSTVRQANYLSGSESSALVFRYTVQSGDEDTDGVSVGSAISLNGGTIKDSAGNDATLTLNGVGDTSAVLVDGVAPVISINDLTTTNTAPIVSGSAGDAVSLTLVVTGVGTYNPTPSGGLWSQQLPTLTLDTYSMTLNGEDAAGNAAVEAAGTLSVVEESVNTNRRIGFKKSVRLPARSSIRESIRA